MTPEQAFSRRIKRFLKEQPESNVSKTIRQIEKFNPHFNSYYELFDGFAFMLGISMMVKTKINKNGYIPLIKYCPENRLNEEPREHKLISESSPISLNKCFEYLAEQILYRIMRIRNLETIITKKE